MHQGGVMLTHMLSRKNNTEQNKKTSPLLVYALRVSSPASFKFSHSSLKSSGLPAKSHFCMKGMNDYSFTNHVGCFVFQ